MKIVLSRKGWDSSAGGSPSPIFPGGEIHSLPIPEAKSGITAGMVAPPTLAHHSLNLGALFSDLSGKAGHSGATHIHLDPVPDPSITAAGSLITCAAFGQDSAAAMHLDNQNVGADDLFLFFGLFRKVQRVGRKWSYVPGAAPIHLIWGWLHVGRIEDPATKSLPSGLAQHPHVLHRTRYPSNNRLYLPGTGFSVAGKRIRGSGTFLDYNPNRQLTQKMPPALLSDWEMPSWLVSGGRLALSYHGRRHVSSGPGIATIRFRSVGRGQEFVFDRALSPTGVDAFLFAVFV